MWWNKKQTKATAPLVEVMFANTGPENVLVEVIDISNPASSLTRWHGKLTMNDAYTGIWASGSKGLLKEKRLDSIELREFAVHDTGSQFIGE